MIHLPIRLIDKRGDPFVVRRYEPADRAALEAMYEDFEPKRAAQGLPPSGEAAVRRWLDRVLARGEHLLVEADDCVIGHAMLIPMEDGGAELANFLHQTMRDRGIGTAMNEIAVELARATGYDRIWLSVEPSNRAAVRSYQKSGFQLLAHSYWDPEIEMEVRLRR